MAILGYKDILQYSTGGASGIWASKTVSVVAGSDGLANASFPVDNVILPGFSKVFRRDNVTTGTVSLQIALNAAITSSLVIHRFGAIGILGLRAIPATPIGGYDYELDVRVRDFAGYDQRRTYYGAESSGQWPRQLWFSGFSGRTDNALAGAQGGTLSGEILTLQIDITENMATSTVYTLEIGRIVLMNCMTGRFEPTPTLGSSDTSQIVRSFSGVPYVLQGTPSRQIAGRLIALPDEAIYGASKWEANGPASGWGSTLDRVAREAGSKGEVVFIPEDYSTTVASSGGRNYYPSAWQTRPVWGRLDDGVRAIRNTTTQATPAPGTQVNALWDMEFSITESPL